MAKNLQSKIGSFFISAIERSVLVYFSDIKKNTVHFIRSTPDIGVKIYSAYTLLLCLAAIAASAVAIIIPAGIIMIIVTLIDSSFNKLLIAGILFLVWGVMCFLGGIMLLKFISSAIHSSMSKASEEIARKIEK